MSRSASRIPFVLACPSIAATRCAYSAPDWGASPQGAGNRGSVLNDAYPHLPGQASAACVTRSKRVGSASKLEDVSVSVISRSSPLAIPVYRTSANCAIGFLGFMIVSPVVAEHVARLSRRGAGHHAWRHRLTEVIAPFFSILKRPAEIIETCTIPSRTDFMITFLPSGFSPCAYLMDLQIAPRSSPAPLSILPQPPPLRTRRDRLHRLVGSHVQDAWQ